MNFIIFIRKNLFCIPASIEVVKQKRQHFRVVFVYFKLSEFTPHIVIPDIPDKITMGIKLIGISQVIFKILKNSLSVALYQIPDLLLFQLCCKRISLLNLL